MSNDAGLVRFAKKHYAPVFYTEEEFQADYHKILVMKKMFSRYQKTETANVPLLLNMFITLHNVFDTAALNVLLFSRMTPVHWPVVKTFLVFLSIYQETGETSDIPLDPYIAAELANIRWRGRIST